MSNPDNNQPDNTSETPDENVKVSVNLLDELSWYNKDEINPTINELKEHIKEQEKIHQVLKNANENVTENVEQLDNFIDEHSIEIENQKESIEELIDVLKMLVVENEYEKTREDEYNELVDSYECKDVVLNLNKIRDMRNDIKSFLEEVGIMKLTA